MNCYRQPFLASLRYSQFAIRLLFKDARLPGRPSRLFRPTLGTTVRGGDRQSINVLVRLDSMAIIIAYDEGADVGQAVTNA
jgi:hypothetical protein